MRNDDKMFAGAIAQNYDRYLIPLLFAPYAVDLAERLLPIKTGSVLETACGTGAVTRELRGRLAPGVTITATDLNPDMLQIATQRVQGERLSFATADAQQLPFPDESFDAVVCQFGVMFFPDKALAFREARRVLRPDGILLFSVWDSLEKNRISLEVARAFESAIPEIAPCFISRVPFSCGDCAPVLDLLRQAGFGSLDVATVEKMSRANSARDAATGLGEGTPVRAELYAGSEERAAHALDAATKRLESTFGSGEITAPMSAHVISARR